MNCLSDAITASTSVSSGVERTSVRTEPTTCPAESIVSWPPTIVSVEPLELCSVPPVTLPLTPMTTCPDSHSAVWVVSAVCTLLTRHVPARSAGANFVAVDAFTKAASKKFSPVSWMSVATAVNAFLTLDVNRPDKTICSPSRSSVRRICPPSTSALPWPGMIDSSDPSDLRMLPLDTLPELVKVTVPLIQTPSKSALPEAWSARKRQVPARSVIVWAPAGAASVMTASRASARRRTATDPPVGVAFTASYGDIRTAARTPDPGHTPRTGRAPRRLTGEQRAPWTACRRSTSPATLAKTVRPSQEASTPPVGVG